MASGLNRLGFIARASSYRNTCCAFGQQWVSRCRAFHNSSALAVDDKRSDIPHWIGSDENYNDRHFDPQMMRKSKRLPHGWSEKMEEVREGDELQLRTLLDDEDLDVELTPEEILKMQQAADRPTRPPAVRRGPPNDFFVMGEEKDEPGSDPEYNNDDITTTGHAELEQHREMREFARVIAWDMPLLYNHRKKFQPPTTEKPLRFRYTTYLGETHPAARKVVVTFRPSALPNLTPIQTSKLIKLLGVRYNPSIDEAKISCEMFPTAAQNKRYLGDLIKKLSTEARNEDDTFEDVPFDFRHHKLKKRFEFPEEWKMTEERKAQLEEKRAALLQKQLEQEEQGRLIEGKAVLDEAVAAETEKVMVLAQNPDKETNARRQPARVR